MDTNTACESCFSFFFCSALVENPGSRWLKPLFVTGSGSALLHSESHLRFKFTSKLMGVEQRTKQQTASFLVTFPQFLTQPKTLAGTDLWLPGGKRRDHPSVRAWWSAVVHLHHSPALAQTLHDRLWAECCYRQSG